ncbi:MAG: hypothetical protein ACOY8P_10485 [Thermodesulfobacteriota bacterium]
MPPRHAKELTDFLRKWYFVVRSDPETVQELRHLLLGLAVCLVILYAGNILFVKPLEKGVAQREARRAELLSQDPGQASQVLSAEQQSLRKEQQRLAEENAILTLQEGFLKEQWQMWGNAERFTRIIFTLLPRAPVNLENSIRQMSQLEKRSKEGFAVYAVNLAGEATFQELYRYLAYVEAQPEVSVIEDLAVERLPMDNYQKPAKVRFSVVMGRLAYEGKAAQEAAEAAQAQGQPRAPQAQPQPQTAPTAAPTAPPVPATAEKKP